MFLKKGFAQIHEGKVKRKEAVGSSDSLFYKIHF
jgi:hypothetical protein